MKKEINPKDGVHGRWYSLKTCTSTWLIKFDRVEYNSVYDLLCRSIGSDSIGGSRIGIALSMIKSFTEATPEEVEKYFPGEGYTTKEEIMQECIRRFPKGSKVRCASRRQIFTVSKSYLNSSGSDWLIQDVYYHGDNSGGILAVSEESYCGFYLYKDGKYATLVEEPENPMLDKLKEAYTNQPEAVQESVNKINAMEQPDERLVYVYTDKEDGMIYVTPKFDPHVGGHNINEVLSKAEDNSVIYEARPVGVKKIYLEEV